MLVLSGVLFPILGMTGLLLMDRVESRLHRPTTTRPGPAGEVTVPGAAVSPTQP
ncbi:hypothetical protein RHODO2019_19160 (plasmid) [Rhodococcus antarcticus]|uniref:BCCT, betaine/carnitine/choline family transporter n=1 Tax=Rhodococcus antarcticus TaxID=2987751 RepID=A0ABY6P5Y4_9NOCA|nr:hypothetical protein [Rhodococcus antarcticus]UZJ27050.1 hypothetical protein RHODO2019_19160 [Rhodococcus antarcticus]